MNVAIILAGGKGSRMGLDIPKQYYEVNGVPIISYGLQTFFLHDKIDAIQIVADEIWRAYIRQCIFELQEKSAEIQKFRGFSEPGENRQLSIYRALTDVREYAADDTTIIVHDAVRPCVTAEQISRCVEEMSGHDGVLPVLPMKDTVYLGDGHQVASLLERERLFAGQAPEAFRLASYYEANRKLFPDRIRLINGSAEPAVLAGLDIVMIRGDEENFKITTAVDLERFEKILNRGSEQFHESVCAACSK